jgi:hypothetical protein
MPPSLRLTLVERAFISVVPSKETTLSIMDSREVEQKLFSPIKVVYDLREILRRELYVAGFFAGGQRRLQLWFDQSLVPASFNWAPGFMSFIGKNVRRT